MSTYGLNSNDNISNDLSSIASASSEEVVKKFLVYLDRPGAPAEKEEQEREVRYTLNLPGSCKYAEGLIGLVRTHGAERVANAAHTMISECHDILARLQIPVSPAGQSRSWACWDMGKQYYYLHHPEEADPNYSREDPLVSPEKFQEIVDRHVGWEVYPYSGFPTPGLEICAQRLEVRELLAKEPKQNKTLSSKDLAMLGRLIRTELGANEKLR